MTMCKHCVDYGNVSNDYKVPCDCFYVHESEDCVEAGCVCKSCPCAQMGVAFVGACGYAYCEC